MLIICVNIAFDVAWFTGLLLHIQSFQITNTSTASCWYQIPMKQTQKLPVKSNIVAYSDNPEQRLPMYCIWDKFYKMELFANYKHNK